MTGRLRRLIAGLATVSLLAGAALPVGAQVTETEQSPNIHPAADALFMRPLGFVSLVTGAVLFVPAGLFTALTRPQDMDEVFDAMVMGPVRFTWVDPLGSHPRQ